MEALFFHKPISVLEYCKGSTLQRIRQLSRSTRKIVKFVLKDRRLRVNKLTKKLFEAFPFSLSSTQEIDSIWECDGSSIHLEADLVKSYGKFPFKPYNIYLQKKLTQPKHVKQVFVCKVSNRILDNYAKLTIGRVKCLLLGYLTDIKVKYMLDRIESVHLLFLSDLKLNQNLTKFSKIRNLKLKDVKIAADLYFPELKTLSILSSSGFSKIKCSNLQELDVKDSRLKEIPILVAECKKLKKLIVNDLIFRSVLPYLTNHLRYLKLENEYNRVLQLKNLLEICTNLTTLKAKNCRFMANDVEETSLRYISAEPKFLAGQKLPLKRALIDRDNFFLFDSKSYLFDNCTSILIVLSDTQTVNISIGTPFSTVFSVKELVKTLFSSETKPY